MKTKLLIICLFIFLSGCSEQQTSDFSNDLSGKKLSCYQHLYIQTYHFEDNKNFTSHRYNNFEKIHKRDGLYNISEFSEYINLHFPDGGYFKHFVIDRKTLRVSLCSNNRPCDNGGLMHYCKLFKGTSQELKKHAQKENEKRINTRLEKMHKEILKEKKEWEKTKKKFKL